MTSSPQTSFIHSVVTSKIAVAILGLVCIALISATAYRTHKNYSEPSNSFNWQQRGLSDFHYGTYFPATAFRQGVNPYSPEVMERFPVSSPSRPCPPITFIVHLPFTFFDLATADVIFFVYNTCLLLLLAYMSVVVCNGRMHLGYWLLVSAILLVSRPGHISLFTGYYTIELVLGTLVALHFGKTRPWIAALGMLIASAKPTFILPLILLMLARKNYRATIIGIVFCTIAGVGGLAWLAKDSSFVEVVQGISAGQEAFHADETEYPINTWTRIDLLGMIAKTVNWIPDDKTYLISMFGFLILPCVVIRQMVDLERDSGVLGTSSLIAILSLLLGLYHHSYDCLLVVVPWVGVTFFSSKVLPEISQQSKWILSVLLAVPLLNYLSTQSARNLLELVQTSFVWQAITVINGICLLFALLLVLASAWRPSGSDSIQKDFGR